MYSWFYGCMSERKVHSNYYHTVYTQDISNNFINTKILVKQIVITNTQTVVLQKLVVLLTQRLRSNT